MRYHHYLRTAEKIIGEYGYETPLPFFLRNYYRANRRMGSTDRRTAGSLVYGYFRTKALLEHLPVDEHLKASWFLCHEESTPLLAALQPEWDQHATLPSADKLALLEGVYGLLDPLRLLPFRDHLSEGIDAGPYSLSMLKQPRLFIRLRPEKAGEIKERLEAEGLSFAQPEPFCLSLDNSSRADQLLEAFKGYFEIQDYSSQLTGRCFHPAAGESWWDACAGSGGKALLLQALEPDVKLYLSDNRASILRNLKERLKAAGITDYRLQETDLISEKPSWEKESFDGIILDAPCSGSGTWGRSPEMRAAFKEEHIKEFRSLQERLVKNVLPYLKPGSPLVYITCSVFREENEQLVEAVCQAGELEVEEQALLKGYEYSADTMFVARMLKR
ncbi:16S rRNA (cytosine967-C5)-methyltransferase [Anseongella ginsenosidimutans]|uniref:16S rRNA (Cytosine967-C5)-methyltransferase n=1 Tax=Anseongella ginsenosidimutans TaxID=496056 RepID=A0A4R3KNA7_9SPHI|nr:RsmB/NOP family class I SAM-dependent RNA methyltransferase [Anseongella ginsenosidimutans]QEC52722.1 RsmB/NOP family class I SAM-dependent RNA methyltransferase [Anseongella ginsenosidimutans]TCS85472.1 16S rRNA (cytosine967-C5)-methyltransferase [Anseongella ginsenosidimutans]